MGTIKSMFPGGGSAPKGNATPAHVLEPFTFQSATSKGVQTGIMPDNGAVNVTLDAGGSYAVPEGYHDGTGLVAARTLASQTGGDATAADIEAGKTAWVDGVRVVGTMPNVAAATPSVSVDANGLITAQSTQAAGQVAAATPKATKQLTTQAGGTITPTNAVQTAAAAGVYTTGAVTVAAVQGDATAADVAKGKTFQSASGVGLQTGTKVPEGTATPADVVAGLTFMSAASESLQTGTRSSGTLRSATGTFTAPTSGTGHSCTSSSHIYTANIGFRPTYLYVYHYYTVSDGSIVLSGIYWNGSIIGNKANGQTVSGTVSKTNTGFKIDDSSSKNHSSSGTTYKWTYAAFG